MCSHRCCTHRVLSGDPTQRYVAFLGRFVRCLSWMSVCRERPCRRVVCLSVRQEEDHTLHNGRLVPHGEQLNLPIVAFPALHALQNLHIPADCCISCCAQEMCFLARLLGVHTDVEQCRSDAATFGPKMEQGKWGSGHHKRLPQFILGLAPWHKKVAAMTTPSGGTPCRFVHLCPSRLLRH